MRKTVILGLVAVALVAASCAPKKKEVAFDTTTLNMKEVMGHVVDFGAQTVWHAQGSYDDATGTHSLVPTTEEGWIQAESGAATVAASANLLLLPGYRRDDGDWVTFANQLRDRAMDARAAIIAQDDKKMFQTGADLYQVCVDCHAKYVLPFLDNKTGEPIKGGPLDHSVNAPAKK